MFLTVLFVQLCTWSHIIPHAQGQCFLSRLRLKRGMISLCPPVFCFLASTVVYCSALIDTVTSHKVHVAQTKYRSQTGAVPYAYNAHLAECRCVTQIHHHHPPPHPHGGRLRLTLVQLLYLLLTDTLRGALNSLGNCCNCLFMSIFYISSSLSSLGF